jgi:hypothetical protein
MCVKLGYRRSQPNVVFAEIAPLSTLENIKQFLNLLFFYLSLLFFLLLSHRKVEFYRVTLCESHTEKQLQYKGYRGVAT